MTINQKLAAAYNGELAYVDISDNPDIPYEVEFAANDCEIVACFLTSYEDVDGKFIAIYRCTIVDVTLTTAKG